MQKILRWLLTTVMLSALLFNGCSLLQVAEKDDEPAPVVEEIPAEELEEVDVIDLTETAALEKKTTASGISYTLLEYGEGPRLTKNMRVEVHYAAYLAENRTRFDSSYERDEPISFVLGAGMVIEGWEKALPNLRVGDKARLWIPDSLAYGKAGRAPIPPNADLIFDLEILDAGEIDIPVLFEFEEPDTLVTESGLQIIVKQKGSGALPVPGNIIVAHYSGYLNDSTLFDSSIQRGVPVRFVLGSSQVIRGWDEGFALLKEGSRARMILPPWLAYGDKGADIVPPDETIFFDVELLEVLR